MCNPTVAMVAISAGSAALQYKIGKQQQENAYARQIRQNELAKKNAIMRYASAQLKIRQTLKQAAQKDYLETLEGRKIRSKFITEAGDAGGLALSGSTENLLRNYYRTEGNYRNSLRNNMDINISQFERNLEAIQFGQESQSVYETPPNPHLLFASSALNVANSYFDLKVRKEREGIK